MRVEMRVKGQRSVLSKTRRITNAVKGRLAKRVVKKSYKFARRIMPVDTGAMLRQLQIVNRANSAELRLNQPRDGRDRPYHMWMHGRKAIGRNINVPNRGYDTSSGAYRPTSGKPKFMDATYRYMKEIVKIEMNKLARAKR